MGKGVGSKMEVDAWNREGRNGEPGGGLRGTGVWVYGDGPESIYLQ